jgi:hypothetical protein
MFPAHLPPATAFYETMYVVTFALHVLFMHYVVAGSLYVAVAVSRQRGRFETHDPLAEVVRDWLPFMAGAAITAGVAPLLFLQIVHYRAFYTANDLLSWRWMLLIPVLIVAFYLLYTSKIRGGLRPWLRLVIVWSAAGCFLFAGFCWSTNHLLSLAEADWPAVYRSGRLPVPVTRLVARMSVWILSAFPTMSLLAGWQLRDPLRNCPPGRAARDCGAAITARMALIGLIASLPAMGAALASSPVLRDALAAPAGRPYVVAGIAGMALQGFGWWRILRGTGWSRRALHIVSAGLALMLVCGSVLRELSRLQASDLSRLADQHAAAARIGGWSMFLVFALLNAVWIAACVVVVRRQLSRGEPRV